MALSVITLLSFINQGHRCTVCMPVIEIAARDTLHDHQSSQFYVRSQPFLCRDPLLPGSFPNIT